MGVIEVIDSMGAMDTIEAMDAMDLYPLSASQRKSGLTKYWLLKNIQVMLGLLLQYLPPLKSMK